MPFYVAGAVLVVWAIGLSAVGLTWPSFPYGQRGARGVLLLSFVLVAVAIGASVATSK